MKSHVRGMILHSVFCHASFKRESYVVPDTGKVTKSSTVLSRGCVEPQQPCYFLHTVSDKDKNTLKDHFS